MRWGVRVCVSMPLALIRAIAAAPALRESCVSYGAQWWAHVPVMRTSRDDPVCIGCGRLQSCFAKRAFAGHITVALPCPLRCRWSHGTVAGEGWCCRCHKPPGTTCNATTSPPVEPLCSHSSWQPTALWANIILSDANNSTQQRPLLVEVAFCPKCRLYARPCPIRDSQFRTRRFCTACPARPCASTHSPPNHFSGSPQPWHIQRRYGVIAKRRKYALGPHRLPRRNGKNAG